MREDHVYTVALCYWCPDQWLIRRNGRAFDVVRNGVGMRLYQTDGEAHAALSNYLEAKGRYVVFPSRSLIDRWVIRRGSLHGPVVRHAPGGIGADNAFFKTEFAAKEAVCLLLLQESANGS